MFRRRTLTAMCTFAALFTAAAAAAPAGEPDWRPYAHAQRLIDVGGRRMNLYCTGAGSPAVVLDTSGDDSTAAWRLVQPAVARTTRVCSYDGAGLGFSDPPGRALDADAAVRSLHVLLSRAGVARPFVLVGYSLSGLYDRLYADRYRHDVAGMVLVSPNVPNQTRRLAAIAPALGAAPSPLAWLDGCGAAAARGQLRPATVAGASCAYTPPDPTMPRPLLDAIRRMWTHPGPWLALASEARADDATSAEVVREQRGYGRLPLVVLTTVKDIDVLPIARAQKTSLRRAWVAWHAQIARLSESGSQVVVHGASQALPIERPSVVVAAIGDVVRRARDAATRAAP